MAKPNLLTGEIRGKIGNYYGAPMHGQPRFNHKPIAKPKTMATGSSAQQSNWSTFKTIQRIGTFIYRYFKDYTGWLYKNRPPLTVTNSNLSKIRESSSSREKTINPDLLYKAFPRASQSLSEQSISITKSRTQYSVKLTPPTQFSSTKPFRYFVMSYLTSSNKGERFYTNTFTASTSLSISLNNTPKYIIALISAYINNKYTVICAKMALYS